MRKLRHPGIWLALLILLALSPAGLGAQDADVSYVVSDGVGTVYLPPSHVVFWLHFPLPEGDLKTALAAGAPIQVALREYLNDRDLRPSAIDVYPPRIGSLEHSAAEFSAELRFSMAGMVGGVTGPAKLGALCEEMKALAAKFGCRLSEPDFVVAERNVPIQSAVQEATKRAFVAASGAASGLGGSLRGVVEIKILEIVWNGPPDTQAGYPNIENIACTAKVQVTYDVHY